MREIKAWFIRLKLNKYAKFIFLLLLLLAVMVAGFTYYGDKAGNFVIKTRNDSGVNIALSVDETRQNTTDFLAAKGLPEQNLTTLSWFRDVDLTSGLGSKNDETGMRYFCFSFYLINLTDRTVDYEMTMNIVDVTKNVDSVLRVAILEEEQSVFDTDVYAKAKEADDEYGKAGDTEGNEGDRGEPYKTYAFASDKIAFYRQITGFKSSDYVKYTIVLWLEGNDPQAVNDIKRGSLRMSLNIIGR